jgi:SAM-dependent methyltransferase
MSPLIPNTPERLALRLQQMPAPLLDLWSAPAFAAVLSAIRLGIFTTLAKAPMTSEKVAQACKTDPRGTLLLLETLDSLDYVGRRGENYSLTRMARTWLTPGGTADLSSYYRYWGALTEHFLMHLDESIRTGRPPVDHAEWLEQRPEVARWLQEGLTAMATMIAPDVAKAIAVPEKAKRVLDIGGGHGVYALAVLERYPQVTAVIAHTEQALATGRDNVAASKFGSRVEFHAGDLLHDPLPHGFDLALLFNVVHGYQHDDNVTLLRRAHDTLKPGGRIAVLEQVQGSSPLPLGRAALNLLSLSFFHVLGGQAHTFEDIRDWLGEAGFVDIERRNVARAGSSVITAHRPR